MKSKKIILVGYSPSCKGEITPDDVLSAHNPGSGRTLAKLCGLSRDEYNEKFDRINLHYRTPEKKTSHGDKEAAELLAAKLIDRRVVFVGQAVAKAFGYQMWEPFVWYEKYSKGLLSLFNSSMIPHPSGLNRFYNNPRNVRKAKRFLRSL